MPPTPVRDLAARRRHRHTRGGSPAATAEDRTPPSATAARSTTNS